jgi:uncharacterized membrane protein YphA (DoxX/SURF4 family)
MDLSQFALLPSVLQVILALGLMNVWIIRPAQETRYRGGASKNLREEFAVYGMPPWFYELIRILKLGAALGLLVGLKFHEGAVVAAGLLVVLMLGALVMHIKVKDPLLKSVPAFFMLMGSLAVFATRSVL